MSESVIESCVWPIEPGPCCRDLPDDVDPALIDSAIAEASDILRRLSGGVLGLCHQTLRPLHMCMSCRSTCCGGADGIPLFGLSGEPVDDVLQVTIGEIVIDPDTYWYEDGMLWRVPPAKWPTKDPKWQPCGTGAAFCVEVLAGVAPGPWDLRVGAELACELVKSCIGVECRIPANATAINAQGVTITLDPATFANLIPEVSAWVQAINPRGSKSPAEVWSPDLDGTSRRQLIGGPKWLR